jgi:hypothetical protein
MAARISGEFILTGEASMPSDDPELLFERLLERCLQREIAPDDCPDAGILAAFHEGTLSDDETLACRKHFAKCARCKSVIEALEASDAMLSPAQEYVPAADAATPEISGYGAGKRKSVRHIIWTRLQPFKGWLMPAAVALAAGVFFLIGILAIRQNEKGAVPMAMKKTPIEKLEKRYSPGETVRPATEMTSQKKAELKIEKESALIEESIKSRQRLDTLTDAPKSTASKMDLDKAAQASQLRKSITESFQREAFKKDTVDSTVSTELAPVIEAQPEHVSENIIDEFKIVSDEDLDKVARDNRAIPMDKELRIKAEIQAEYARTDRQVPVVSPDRNVQWRFGAGGLIEKSVDGGKSWNRQSSNVTDDLLAGVAPTEKICWLVGKNGTVILAADGEHWTRLPFPSKIDLGGIASKDALNALVWDKQNKAKFYTQDGGNTWTETTRTAPHAQ